jgi:hypothetical protein
MTATFSGVSREVLMNVNGPKATLALNRRNERYRTDAGTAADLEKAGNVTNQTF